MSVDLSDIKREFTKFLKRKNMKVTQSRLNLIDLIAKYGKHFEVEELVNWIATQGDRSVSRSTIYRTIKLLQEFGVIKEVIKQNNRTIYEFVAGKAHHDHLVCMECGKIIEFVNEDIEKLQDEVCKEYDFQPTHHRLEIFGVCSECRNSDLT
ncbi:MAG: transcriptional repressor [Aquificae bacterium]|nr:transcriptional repressor [Aquificota bacterium]